MRSQRSPKSRNSILSLSLVGRVKRSSRETRISFSGIHIPLRTNRNTNNLPALSRTTESERRCRNLRQIHAPCQTPHESPRVRPTHRLRTVAAASARYEFLVLWLAGRWSGARIKLERRLLRTLLRRGRGGRRQVVMSAAVGEVNLTERVVRTQQRNGVLNRAWV